MHLTMRDPLHVYVKIDYRTHTSIFVDCHKLCDRKPVRYQLVDEVQYDKVF